MAANMVWFRTRPSTALAQVRALVAPTTENSFFSDHTIAVTGLAFAALLVSRRWGIAAVMRARRHRFRSVPRILLDRSSIPPPQSEAEGPETETMMKKTLYRKNIRQWEQWSRAAAGVVMIVVAVAVASVLGKALLLGGGAFMVVTGFIGWCPACAMIGRSVEDADHVPS